MAGKRYVSARAGEKNSVIYKTADGPEFLHSGGTRAWRNNNPGNLVASEKSGRSIGKAGGFAVFPTYEDGWAALKYSLTHFYSDLKLDKVFEKYAPATDNNDPQRYIKMVKQFSGLDSTRTLGQLSEAELAKFMAAIQRVEGWKEGKIEAIPYAQQFEVKGVDGKPLSGLAYVMSFFTSRGEQKKIAGKTDAEGKTAVAQTDTRSPVSLKLPRPDPGQSLKGTGVKAKADAAPQVVAAEVTAKPWYASAYSTCLECEDEKHGPAAEAAPASGTDAAATVPALPQGPATDGGDAAGATPATAASSSTDPVTSAAGPVAEAQGTAAAAAPGAEGGAGASAGAGGAAAAPASAPTAPGASGAGSAAVVQGAPAVVPGSAASGASAAVPGNAASGASAAVPGSAASGASATVPGGATPSASTPASASASAAAATSKPVVAQAAGASTAAKASVPVPGAGAGAGSAASAKPPAAAPAAGAKPAGAASTAPAASASAPGGAKPAANASAPKPPAPTATVKQGGAVQASATVNKAANLVEQVVKEPGVFVTWEFNTSGGSGKVLRGLPYFIAEMSGNTGKPLVAGQRVHLVGGDNKIRQKVPFGKEVALYLGNDAKAKYRTYPLYRVKAEEGLTDVVVKVAETGGPGYDHSQEKPFDEQLSGTKKTFKANLYGTTWMKFSHKFTEAEASVEGAGESPALKDALEKIYKGAPVVVGSSSIVLNVMKPNQKTLKISWPRSAFLNCFSSIGSHADLMAAKQEFLPRVNPQTYKAFLKAAFEVDADEMEISSGWRPMLGSVLHRLGIGLDVNRIKVGNEPAVYSRSITGAELEYRQLMEEKKLLTKKKSRTSAEDQRLNEIKATEAAKSNAAVKAIHDSESNLLRSFTSKLRANCDVKQTFDPWEMDVETSDKVPQSPNRLSTDNEKLHRTHLHITVRDSELGH